MDNDKTKLMNMHRNGTCSSWLGMNTVAPAPPQRKTSRSTCVANAVEEPENSHISLFQAARDGRLDIVKNKLAKPRRDVDKKDKEKSTALHYAVRFNNIEVVKYLIKKGANPNIPGEDGATPIHYAARYKSTQSTGDVHAEQATIDNAEPTGHLLTVESPDALDSGKDSSESILSCLLQASNANVNCQDKYGSTPLHYAAATKGNRKFVEEIIKCEGVDFNAQNKQKATPLHDACTHGNPDVARILIQEGAKLRAPDDKKMTPLHYAARDKRLECVKLVVEAAKEEGGDDLVKDIIVAV